MKWSSNPLLFSALAVVAELQIQLHEQLYCRIK